MKITSFALRSISLSIFGSAFAGYAQGQNFVNGSFDGPLGPQVLGTPWVITSETPDTWGADGRDAGVLIPTVLSPDGGTFAAAADQPATGFLESFEQTVDGFVIGNSHSLSFWESNIGGNVMGVNGRSSGNWVVLANGIEIGGGATLRPGAEGANVWSSETLSFVAQATSITFSFHTQTTQGGSSWLGIDGVSIQPVPEPSVSLLLSGGMIGLVLQRRRKALPVS